MSGELVLRLHHDGRQWLAEAPGLMAAGRDWQALDASLVGQLQARGLRDCRVPVFMSFDRNTLPHWLRQYASHYFNRRIELQV